MDRAGCQTGQLRDPETGECKNRYNYAVTNPPFTFRIDQYDLMTKHPELGEFGKMKTSDQVFLAHMLNIASDKIAIVVPDSLLANSSSVGFRKILIQKGFPQAVISLPTKIYQGTGTKTSVVILDKKPTSKQRGKIFMAIIDEKDTIQGRKVNTIKEETAREMSDAYIHFRRTGKTGGEQ